MHLNVDDFCKDVARSLQILASVFPRPRDIFVEDVWQDEETDEFGMHSDRYLACFQALVWLREEGFIRYTQTLRADAVEQAVLTSRCLVLLVQPSSLEGDSAAIAIEANTLLHRLQHALEEGSSTTLRMLVLDMIADMTRFPGLGLIIPGAMPDQAI